MVDEKKAETGSSDPAADSHSHGETTNGETTNGETTNGETTNGETSGGLPWLSMGSYTAGLQDAFGAWRSFITEQCQVATSYDPSGNIAAQALDNLRRYAEGVAGLSNRLIKIATDVYSTPNRTPGDAD